MITEQPRDILSFHFNQTINFNIKKQLHISSHIYLYKVAYIYKYSLFFFPITSYSVKFSREASTKDSYLFGSTKKVSKFYESSIPANFVPFLRRKETLSRPNFLLKQNLVKPSSPLRLGARNNV